MEHVQVEEVGVTDRSQQIGYVLWNVRMDKQRPDSLHPHTQHELLSDAQHTTCLQSVVRSGSVLTCADTTDSLTGALDKEKERVRRVTGRLESQQ